MRRGVIWHRSSLAGTLLSMAVATAFAQTNVWVKYDNTIPPPSDGICTNGQIPLGTGSGTCSGDTAYVSAPCVIKDGASYRMWYSGHDGVNYRIYTATSANGVTWFKVDNRRPPASDGAATNTIPIGATAGRGDTTHAVWPAVIKDGNIYRMWYSGHDGSTYRTYAATSADAVVWYKLDNTKPPNSDNASTNTIPLGTSGRGDSSRAYTPCVIKDGNRYLMWYTGWRSGYPQQIFCATSADARVWYKVDNQYHSPASDTVCTNGLWQGTRGDRQAVLSPVVVKDDATFRMWYTGADSDWTNRIFYATSPDGFVWTKADNTVPNPSDSATFNGRIALGTAGRGDALHVNNCWVIKDGPQFKMWYTGYRSATNTSLYYATLDIQWPTLGDSLATNIESAAADLAAHLVATGEAPAVVRVYWGTNDGGFVKAHWQTNASLGICSPGWLTNHVTGLLPARTYYFRFLATNSWGEDWSDDAAAFTTKEERPPTPGTTYHFW